MMKHMTKQEKRDKSNSWRQEKLGDRRKIFDQARQLMSIFGLF